MIYLSPLDRARVERGATHLHGLGSRAIGEFLAEVAVHSDDLHFIIGRLGAYQQITPAMVEVSGGDRFSVARFRLVPK